VFYFTCNYRISLLNPQVGFIYLLLRQMAARHTVIQAVIYTAVQKLKTT